MPKCFSVKVPIVLKNFGIDQNSLTLITIFKLVVGIFIEMDNLINDK